MKFAFPQWKVSPASFSLFTHEAPAQNREGYQSKTKYLVLADLSFTLLPLWHCEELRGEGDGRPAAANMHSRESGDGAGLEEHDKGYDEAASLARQYRKLRLSEA